jgi:hypothetical protein
MLTSEIISLANRDGIANGDLNAEDVLYKIVIPQFFDDVGEVGWRRKYQTVSTVAGTQVYDLPAGFVKAGSVFLPSGSGQAERDLLYIGEDPIRVSNAEIATERKPPYAYYIVQNADSAWKRLKLENPADGVYTIIVAYWLYLLLTEPTDLTLYLPEQVQRPLIDGLRQYILEDRYGVGDDRARASEMRYRRGVDAAMNYEELAPRNYAVFVR